MFSLLMYFVRNDKNKDDQSINVYQHSHITVDIVNVYVI